MPRRDITPTITFEPLEPRRLLSSQHPPTSGADEVSVNFDEAGWSVYSGAASAPVTPTPPPAETTAAAPADPTPPATTARAAFRQDQTPPARSGTLAPPTNPAEAIFGAAAKADSTRAVAAPSARADEGRTGAAHFSVKPPPFADAADTLRDHATPTFPAPNPRHRENPAPPQAHASAVALGAALALDRRPWATARQRTADLVNRLIDPDPAGPSAPRWARPDGLAADRAGVGGHRADGWADRRPSVEASTRATPARNPARAAASAWVAAVGARVRPHLRAIALLGSIALLAAFAVAWATGRGVGPVGDSVDYLAAARSLRDGAGPMTLDYKGGFEPMTRFPPGYPLALAATGRLLGLDPQSAARPLHAAAFGLTALLAGALAWRLTRSPVAGGLAAAGVATCRPVVELSTLILSETLFNALVLLTLALAAVAVARRGRSGGTALPWLISAGLVAGAAVLTRFAGVGLVLAIPAAVLAVGGDGFRQRLAAASAFLAAAALPPMAWTLLFAADAPRSLGFHPPDLNRLMQGVRTVGAFLPPGGARGWLTLGAMLIWAAANQRFAVPFDQVNVSGKRRLQTVGSQRPSFKSAGPLVAFALAYPPFLLAAITVADANVPLNARLLSPLVGPVAVLIVAGAWRLTRGSIARRRIAGGLLAAVASVAGFQSATWAGLAHSAGTGYATAAWDRSATLAALADLPRGFVIYSDAPDLIYARTGRVSAMLPTVHHRASDVPEPAAAEWIDAMGRRLRDTGGWLVRFDRIDRRDFLATPADVAARLKLVPARRRQPRDGSIWQVAGVRGEAG